MLKKESLFPGLYETRANLGTFYFHAGKFDLGIPEIEKALEINPDAHFGREITQLQLVKYVLARRAEGATLPLRDADQGGRRSYGFSEYLRGERQKENRDLTKKDFDEAIKGVLGMMRFGNFQSPVLLEAFGDLSQASGKGGEGNLISARAYLKASYECEDDAARETYREYAKDCLSMQVDATLEGVERDLKKELADADLWYQAVRADELAWIAAGANPEEEFERKYSQDPSVASPFRWKWNNWYLFPLGVIFVILLYLIQLRRKYVTRIAVLRNKLKYQEAASQRTLET